MKRGGKGRKTNKKKIPVWFPAALLAGMDMAVLPTKTERSRFIRNAVCEKLKSMPELHAKNE